MTPVRLWRWSHEDNRWFVPCGEPDDDMGSWWLALPAAEFEALVAERDKNARILASLPGSPHVLDLGEAARFQMDRADKAEIQHAALVALLGECRKSLAVGIRAKDLFTRLDAALDGLGAEK